MVTKKVNNLIRISMLRYLSVITGVILTGALLAQPVKNVVAVQNEDAIRVSFDLASPGEVELLFSETGTEFRTTGVKQTYDQGLNELNWIPSGTIYASQAIFRIQWTPPPPQPWNEGRMVTIGTQVWAGANLNVDRFANGDPIPEAKTAEEWKRAGEYKRPAWCYYNNDPANGPIYGKLYNWYAVTDPRGLAPKGWRVPADGEWEQIINYLGGSATAGLTLKNTSGWFQNGNGSNRSGFAGLPGGYRHGNGTFDDFGKFGYWWSSTEYGSGATWRRSLYYGLGDVGRGSYNKGAGISVRCLRD
jgi:uncharacterized protein (TIGR02145 family)